MQETELYAPIKTHLESQGYTVKGEIGPADLVACRGDDPPVIVEMKTAFALTLFHQAIGRLSITDAVYIAVPRPSGKTVRRAFRDNIALARRLGLGVITVRARDGKVEVHCDPGPYAPRKNGARKTALLREFERRTGDPTPGGATRKGLVTAYRQDALRCLAHLSATGACKGSDVARATEVPSATRLMRDNHYGWFCNPERGIYDLSPAGARALKDWAGQLEALEIA